MNKYIKRSLYIVLFVFVGFSVYLGKSISFKEQMPIYDGLRNTSAIIFAVMGAWIALLYPKKLSQAFDGKLYAEIVEDVTEINKLFRPMIYSTIILLVVIAMSFAVPLGKQISYLHQYKEVFRAVSFGAIACLTFLQFWSLILTLIPGDSIKDDLDEDLERRKLIERMGPNRKVR